MSVPGRGWCRVLSFSVPTAVFMDSEQLSLQLVCAERAENMYGSAKNVLGRG